MFYLDFDTKSNRDILCSHFFHVLSRFWYEKQVIFQLGNFFSSIINLTFALPHSWLEKYRPKNKHDFLLEKIVKFKARCFFSPNMPLSQWTYRDHILGLGKTRANLFPLSRVNLFIRRNACSIFGWDRIPSISKNQFWGPPKLTGWRVAVEEGDATPFSTWTAEKLYTMNIARI